VNRGAEWMAGKHESAPFPTNRTMLIHPRQKSITRSARTILAETQRAGASTSQSKIKRQTHLDESTLGLRFARQEAF
jgi:hypothetical protein